jgi:hypothetical protein
VWDIDIRELRESDVDSLLECQRVCFGPARAKSLAEWRWAFQRPDLPLRHTVAVHEGRVVAAYAGIVQRTWIGGEERLCVQPVDLMVHPDYRRGLSHRGLYVRIGEHFLDGYGVNGDDAMHYGWPVEEARRVGERLMGYDLVREDLALVRELTGDPGVLPGDVREVHELGDELKWLWDRCASEWGAATVRDARWARWRFLERPGHDYRLLGAYDEDLLVGLAVLRVGEWTWEGAMPLCDWLVPAGELAVAHDLERAVCTMARAAGATSLVAVFPDSSPHFALFQELGWRVAPSPYRLVARSFDGRYDPDWLRAYWWYSLADSDLV